MRSIKPPDLEVYLSDLGEYSGHGFICEWVDGHNVEVSQESGSDWVPPTSGRPHCRHKLNINQGQFGAVFLVIPTCQKWLCNNQACGLVYEAIKNALYQSCGETVAGRGSGYCRFESSKL